MSLLVVGAVTVTQVANVDQPEDAEPVGGEIVPMFDGTRRSTVRSFKRTWTVTTRLLSSSEASALRAALVTTTLPVTCSGDLLGGSVSCIPQLLGNTAVNAAGVLKRRMSFKLLEV